MHYIAKCSDSPQQGGKGMVPVNGTSPAGRSNRELSGRLTGFMCVHYLREKRSRKRKTALKKGKRKQGTVGHKLAMWRKKI